jgi:serine/threonine protein kinase
MIVVSQYPANLPNLRVGTLYTTHIGQAIANDTLFQDRYQVSRVLGRGSFGITFLAQDNALPGQPVCVIKLLSPRVDGPALLPLLRERFAREACVLGQLGGHTQIPMLLNYFAFGEELYLVQEFIDGQTLIDLVNQWGPLNELQAIQFLSEMLPVLQYVHTHHVIHRDIKPDNILRSSLDGRLVLIDFGAVKELVHQLEYPSAGFIPVTPGTLGFVPPEQLQGQATTASDIYALGMSCLFLLTSCYPWDFELIANQLQLPKSLILNPAFTCILQKMTALSLSDRYHSVSEVLCDLDIMTASQPLIMEPSPRSPASRKDRLVPSTSVYVAPAIRIAMGIRDWKSRSKRTLRNDNSTDYHRST